MLHTEQAIDSHGAAKAVRCGVPAPRGGFEFGPRRRRLRGDSATRGKCVRLLLIEASRPIDNCNPCRFILATGCARKLRSRVGCGAGGPAARRHPDQAGAAPGAASGAAGRSGLRRGHPARRGRGGCWGWGLILLNGMTVLLFYQTQFNVPCTH